jgi:hypothetical protein
MRSNGLTAATYTPVADLEPPVGAALLDDLRALGVAAYTTPVQSSSMSGFDRPEVRDAVRDRLYVDSASAAAVRELIASRDPTLVEDNDDLTFAQLVAGFDRPLGGTIAPWPVDEDVSDDSHVIDERDVAAGQATAVEETGTQRRWGDRDDDTRSSDDEFLAVTWQSRRGDPDDEHEHFVPDPPEPLPHLEPYKQLAWAGVICGPLFLLIAALTGLSLPGWLSWLAIVGFVGGFVTLVATMSDKDDWDPDDGAVV